MLLNEVVLLVLLIVGWAYLTSADDSSISDVAKLQSRLLKYYDRNRIPVRDRKQLVKPQVTMFIRYFTVDDVSDTISISCSMLVTWKDEYLQWNVSENGFIYRFRINGAKIWQPPLELLTADITQNSNDKASRCMVFNEGSVKCILDVQYVALCAPDPRRWPHDVHNCTLVLGTAGFSMWKIKLEFDVDINSSIRTDFMMDNREWALSATHTWKKMVDIPPHRIGYPSLHFSLLMKRKSATHEAIVIIPALSLTVLNTACGLLTPGSIRISFAMGLVWAHIIYLTNLSYIIPSHGDNPAYIIMFFRDSLVLTTLNIVVSLAMSVLMKLSRSPPRVVSAVNKFVKTGHEKFLSFWKLNSKMPVYSVSEEGDSDIVNTKQWQTFSLIFDKLYFISTTCIYVLFVCMYILY